MKINDTLKHIRINKGLSQKEFSLNILSPSYYSKVEAGISNISAINLLDLLENSNITFSEFIHIYNDFHSEEQVDIFIIIKESIYANNISRLMCLYSKINNRVDKITLLLLDCSIKYIKNENIHDSETNYIKNYLLNIPTWGYFEINIFTIATNFLPPSDSVLISIQVIKNFDNYSQHNQYNQDIIMMLSNLSKVCLLNDLLKEGYYYLSVAKKINTHMYIYGDLILKFLEGVHEIKVSKISSGKKKITTVLSIFEKLGYDMIHTKLNNIYKQIV